MSDFKAEGKGKREKGKEGREPAERRGEFRHRRISVIGAARSGVGAAGVLVRLGAEVRLSDSQTAEQLGAERVAEIQATGARYALGASVADALPDATDLVVTSPGVPRTAEVLQEAVRRGIPVWSEIELAYRLSAAPILAVTGTNGKTTTTLLLAAMLQAAGREALVAGNVSADAIKRTLVDAAFATFEAAASPAESGKQACAGQTASTMIVAEISSFQLEWVERFAPKVGILTNVTPDHLNRHADLEEYAQAKARLFAAQGPDDWAIVNQDDPVAWAIGVRSVEAHPERARLVWFTRRSREESALPGAWVHAGRLKVRLESGQTPVTVLALAELPPTLPGAHSVENVLAAAAGALAAGAEAEAIAEAVRHFAGVPHRMEFVAEVDGVRYINNSMCTNVVAAIRSLQAVDRPTVVIAGGADKALDFSPLVPALLEKARHLVLIGTAADKMEATFRAGGYTALARADTMEAAVAQARRLARPGDAVLLSPACASFDMFRDFEARGAAFRQAVRSLKEEAQ